MAWQLASGMAETTLDAAAPPAAVREKPSARPAQVLATDKALAGGRFDFVFTTTNSDVPVRARFVLVACPPSPSPRRR